jgi:NitT/TauT family transport system substrate-binding protein
MDKKIAIIAIFVVVIVVGGVVAISMMGDDGDEDEKTFYWLSVAPVLQKDQISQGIIDGGVSWEPYCSDSILSGDSHALMWSGEFWPNHPCCILAVNANFAEDNPELVARVVAAHIEATDWVLDTIANKTSNPENYTMLLDMGATFSSRNTTVVEASLEHMTLLYDLNQQFKDYLVNFTNDFIALNQTSNAAVDDRGYDSVEDFIDTFVDDSYLSMSAGLSKVDETVGSVDLGYLNGDLHQFARVVASNVTMWEGTEYEGKDLFTQWGVEIASPAPFANGAFVMQAFDTGLIDMAYLGSPPAILKHLNVNTDNSDIRIVAQVNVEGSAIVVNNEIQTIDDLVGKTIGTPGPGSIQHLMLLAFAEEYDLDLKLAGT